MSNMPTMEATINNSTSLSSSSKMSQRLSTERSPSSMKSLFHGPSEDALSSSSLSPWFSKMSQERSATAISSNMKYLLHEHSDALPSSGIDFLLEVHIRRENSDSNAQKMTRKEQTMILEGARKARNMILEDALKILEA